MEKILVVIDGNSLINRGYYAIQRPMITKEGIYTQGIYAFLSMLFKIKADYKPTHMLVAFDRKAPTFRHIEYKEYKAGRKGMPLELAMEMPILKEILDAMGIARYEIDGYEADDILGTATQMAEDAGVKSFVITGDRDALQLATDMTSVIINKKGMTEFKLYDDAAMIEEYGFDHIQFIDYKALRGDTSDNIPGIPGVGEKTAKALIQEYGSLENIIANSDKLKGSLKDKVEEGAMSAMMSKRLATIIRNVPMELNFDDFEIKRQNKEALIDLYTKLEFKTYLSKLLSEKDDNNSNENSANISEFIYPECIYLNNQEEAFKVLNGINDISVYFACNNNHTKLPKAKFLYFICNGKLYLYLNEDLEKFIFNLFNKRELNISGFDLGKLYYYLFAHNVDIKKLNAVFDSKVAAYLLNPTSKDRNLDELILEYFHIKFETDNKQLSLFDDDNTDENERKRAFLNVKLSELLNLELNKAKLADLFKNIEMPLVKVLASMEAEGIKLDAEALKNFGNNLRTNISALDKEIKEMAGEEFNLNSPQQLGHILFEVLGLPAGKKTTKGYSTNAEILEKLAPDYPIVAKILEYRSYAKLNSTYIEGMIPLQGNDGKIHPHFQQTITATGRLSCTEPNLQNIPIRNELGRQLRKVFTASAEDRVLIGADYSQIELRVMASLSGDKTMINAFNEGRDIHRETASKVFNIPLDEVTSLQRSNAKAVNFGVIYGMSQFGLSSELTISRKEAEIYIKDYFERFKDVKAYLDALVATAKSTGEIRTLYGRRRIIPEINASNYMVRQLGERLAMNTPIQGTAADIIKIAMIKVYDRLEQELPDAKLILQIHDELIIDAKETDKDKALIILKECMESAVKLSVRLIAEGNIAYNWYDLK